MLLVSGIVGVQQILNQILPQLPLVLVDLDWVLILVQNLVPPTVALVTSSWFWLKLDPASNESDMDDVPR